MHYDRRVGKYNPYSEANKIPTTFFCDINAQQERVLLIDELTACGRAINL